MTILAFSANSMQVHPGALTQQTASLPTGHVFLVVAVVVVVFAAAMSLLRSTAAAFGQLLGILARAFVGMTVTVVAASLALMTFLVR